MATPLRPFPLAVLLMPLAIGCTDYRGNAEGTADSLATVDEGTFDEDSEESGSGCQSDADCLADSLGTVCDTSSGTCFPTCIPGQSETCYEGPEETAQVGICKIGSQACQASGNWGGCTGQVLPTTEDCENGADDDCDGNVDAADKDGDGFLSCIEGELADCCDDEITGCVNAHLVNPGAYEVPDNEVDDDCDDIVDETDPTCDGGLISSTGDPMAYARALDLCATSSEDAVNWGVIDAELTLADGTGTPLSVQRSIRQQFGDVLVPSGGENMIVLSSGHAAASGQNAPNFASFEQGADLGTSVNAPLLVPASCPGITPGNNVANDSVMLTLRMRVPTNARSFSAKMYFFSAEYPEWVCSNYNDFFVTLLDSESPENPDDSNIAVYDDGDQLWPVGLNIIEVAPGLFGACQSGQVGCQGELSPWQHDCEGDVGELAGTGFDLIDVTNSCNGADFPVGGGTGWLEMSGNVEPGEVAEIRFAIWDAGGHLFDALVLLDDWQWSLDAASPGVQLP